LKDSNQDGGTTPDDSTPQLRIRDLLYIAATLSAGLVACAAGAAAHASRHAGKGSSKSTSDSISDGRPGHARAKVTQRGAATRKHRCVQAQLATWDLPHTM
jgi:hypothetical protein